MIVTVGSPILNEHKAPMSSAIIAEDVPNAISIAGETSPTVNGSDKA